MRIAVISPYKKLDYLAETVIEGLYKSDIEVKFYQPGNGAKPTDVIALSDFYKYADSADYIFAIWGKKKGTHPGIDYNVVKRINRPDRTVFIDGREWTYSGQPEQGQVVEAKWNPKRRRGSEWVNMDMLNYCKWYFKRECYPEDVNLGIIPLLFGAVDRYYNVSEQEKSIDVFCAYGQINDGLRAETESVCKRLKGEGYNIVVGGEYDYDTYKDILAQSYIAVDAWGGGDCCARLWEILANKTCAFTQKYNILFPYKFTDSKNYVEYETIQEFETKIRYYLNNREACYTVGQEGYKHLKAHHTAEQRVQYIISILNSLNR